MAFRKAIRKRAKLRLAITGPAGSGKTYSALLLAFGLGRKVAMIDTENDFVQLRQDHLLYVDKTARLLELIEAEQVGYNIIIIDSLSHAWNGNGGLLDIHGRIAEAKYRGNGYAAWREATPMQNYLVDALLASPCHIIATMRSKTDYVQTENERGKTEIHKVGLAPVQREGIDYEFSTVFDLSAEHNATASKDRTGIFDNTVFTVSKDTGKILREWLNKGGEA